MRSWLSRWTLTVALAGVVGPSALATDDTTPVDFVRDVRPILTSRCGDCHGPDSLEGGLRLSKRAMALAGGDSGRPAIVPGRPDESRLWQVVSGADPQKLVMPPDGSGPPLSPAEQQILRRWIASGANWPDGADEQAQASEHWAWKAPVEPSLPEVERTAWPRQPLDRFVLAKLEADRLTPAAEADRQTLIRRVSLDLRGLPPSTAELQSFALDHRPDAYERLVDRFLADPAYGERWARMWLDLARYADSKGYGSDPLRQIWRYRDWVIGAFNRNLPYDQFTVEQLAGDLLESPSEDQLLATAFHRNTMSNDEGGTDDEEFRVAAVKDRVDSTLQIWMGLTMGCAKCHSHKYDPITQREYYQVLAIFNQTADADRNDEEPRLRTVLPHQRAAIDRLTRQIAALKLEFVLGRPSADKGALEGRLTEWKKQLDEIEKQVPSTPILRELPAAERRATRMMIKGNFLNPGPEVQPAVLAAFHPLEAASSVDRRALAGWLMDRRNPLTGRVAVNRFWAQLFGAGLVETEEDFGTQGQPPHHPQALDWLASDFSRDWDVKRLLKQIVCSATYRQSSASRPEIEAGDPSNRLLARGPRQRLEAEMVRDQALAISGLLSPVVGGPSVYPPQPEGLWRAAFNGERTWPTSAGTDRYRRGLYTYWRRTVPYPSMATFDAPSREICTIRRVATNTPLQAFVTLNDPAYVEIAQALARKLWREAGPTPDERLAAGLLWSLCRSPSGEERRALTELYQRELEHYRQHADDARRLASEPLGPLPDGADAAELAALTVVANVLLNLDGVLSKR